MVFETLLGMGKGFWIIFIVAASIWFTCIGISVYKIIQNM